MGAMGMNPIESRDKNFPGFHYLRITGSCMRKICVTCAFPVPYDGTRAVDLYVYKLLFLLLLREQ